MSLVSPDPSPAPVRSLRCRVSLIRSSTGSASDFIRRRLCRGRESREPLPNSSLHVAPPDVDYQTSNVLILCRRRDSGTCRERMRTHWMDWTQGLSPLTRCVEELPRFSCMHCIGRGDGNPGRHFNSSRHARRPTTWKLSRGSLVSRENGIRVHAISTFVII